MLRTSIQFAAALGLLACVCAPLLAEPPDFDTVVAPLLAGRCLDCHSGDSPKGKLNLSHRAGAFRGGESGQAIVPGQPEDSLLWQRIEAGEMPPKKPLGEKERNVLRQWIAGGAAWGTDAIDPFRYSSEARAGYDWWSLQPLRRPEIPKVKGAERVRTPIDALLLEKLEAKDLTFSPDAPPRDLIRRLYFDLIGLPPTPEEVAAFEAKCEAEAPGPGPLSEGGGDAEDPKSEIPQTALEELVDQLLASPHYGERWARHWLDVVRYGESDGFERNHPRKNAWHYRDWVIRAFNDDMPYDEFARLQIAGDALRPGDADAAAATGFLVAGVHNTVVGSSVMMQKLARQDELEEIVGTLGQTFLGMTVNCARCHSHKFDPISQTDYYRMIAALDGVRHGEREVRRAADPQRLAKLRAEIEPLRARLADLEAQARSAVLAQREKNPQDRPLPPKPLARWAFDDDLGDALGGLHAEAKEGAKLEGGALAVDGRGYAASAPLAAELREKTLAATVRLADLNQQGGGAISVQTLDGAVFDAIVFGEREAQRWMAGSDFFRRTKSFQGPAETAAPNQPVHFAIVYAADGTITGYRNGQPYGRPYSSSGLVTFKAGQAQVVFGMRHAPAGGNKMLKGSIVEAQLFDRALSADEVAAASGAASNYVSPEEIARALSPQQREEHQGLSAQLAALAGEEKRLAASAQAFKMHAVISSGIAPTRVLKRGDVNQEGEQVAPGGLAALGKGADFGLAENSSDPQRRQALAQWITSENPLFARVIANRLWHYHFGLGIVETPNDFGFNGGRPSHPELLDFLAAELAANGYKLKRLHRMIVLSTAYRQSSRFNAQAAKIDANNRLLWRKSPRRLDAEELRDAMLLVSGRLNRQAGGPGFEDVTIRENNGTTYYTPVLRDEPAHNRRTIYRFTPRGGRSSLLDTFDCPDPSATAPRRSVTTTPLQALALLNNEFVLKTAEHLAARAENEAPGQRAAQIERAFQLVLARPPDEKERAASLALAQKHGLAAVCRALLNTSEFVISP